MVLKTKQWEYLRKCWHLTPREVEVAKLVCDGMDNEQIGKKLHIKKESAMLRLMMFTTADENTLSKNVLS
jgi:FixJ family two-component response regulator